MAFAAVGLAADALALSRLVIDICGLITDLRQAIETRAPLLLAHAKNIQDTLHVFSEMPEGLYDNVSTQLEAIISDLQSIRNVPFWLPYSIRGTLDEVENRLELIQKEYLLGALVDITQRFTKVAHHNLSLPSCNAGLDRVEDVLSFLERNPEGLRIVGIYGQGGLGKTTLLNKLWEAVSLESWPFDARAYVVVRDEPNLESLCALQSDIVEQLFGGGQKKFPSPDFGKGELKENLKNWRISEKPIFLALDNVWDPSHLKALLPDGLADLLPPSSCIVVTSRQFSVIQTLAELCRFQITDHSHVLPYPPRCLSPQESQKLFAHNAGLNIDEHQELLDAIVPLCGGLPSALEALSSLFRSEARRGESAWKEVSEKMQLQEALIPKDCEDVFKALQLSYDRLEPDCQEAFLDVAGFFHGWEWHTVERILGKDYVSALKNHSLLSETDMVNQHTQDEIENLGCPNKLISKALPNENLWPSKVVKMHDLILKFGKCLLAKKDRRLKIVQNESGLINVKRFPDRNMFLWQRSRASKTIQPEDLQGMSNMRFLYLNPLTDQGPLERLILSVGKEQPFSSYHEGCRMMRFASLEGPTSEELLREILTSAQLRQLHLTGCPDIEELPSSPTLHFEKLECLHVFDCCMLHRLSKRCDTWEALQELVVSNCEALSRLPEALGKLPNLQTLVIQKCSGLSSLPPLFNLKKLSFLRVDNCCSLSHLPALPKALKILDVSECPLQELPGLQSGLQKINLTACPKLRNLSPIFLASMLQTLHVRGTEVPELGLGLPEGTASIDSLTDLGITECPKLKRLPDSIYNIASLKRLSLHLCSELVELPQEMGKFTSLIDLDISCCEALAQLPEVLGKLPNLQTLVIQKCSGLSSLPPLFNLKKLSFLRVDNCFSLSCLPDLPKALKILDVSECPLEELPGLQSGLRKINLTACPNLRNLSPIFSASTLQTLHVRGTEVSELGLGLPEGMVNIDSLTDLGITECPNLKRLPDSICNITSLKRLSLHSCSELMELPQEMGNFTSLIDLDISCCAKLKSLPESVCDIETLEVLNAGSCSGLLELPQNMGNLSSLRRLHLVSCPNLRLIPDCMSAFLVDY